MPLIFEMLEPRGVLISTAASGLGSTEFEIERRRRFTLDLVLPCCPKRS